MNRHMENEQPIHTSVIVTVEDIATLLKEKRIICTTEDGQQISIVLTLQTCPQNQEITTLLANHNSGQEKFQRRLKKTIILSESDADSR